MARGTEYAISIVDQGTWPRLLSNFPAHTVFHSSPWLQTLAASHGLKVVCAAAYRHDTCEAIFPILEARKGLLRVIGSPLPGWSTAYLGPLFAEGADEAAALASFLKHKAFRRYSYFACKVLDGKRPVDLSEFGFTVVLKYDTFRLDLRLSEDALWKNCRRECRNHIRKAEKSGLEIRFEDSPQFIDDYWAMTVETFGKAGVRPTHDRTFIEQMWQQLQPAGLVRALSAFHDGQRMATLMLLNDHRTMYYWGGASYLQYRRLSAHNLLQWTAIRQAQGMGMHTYDFISTTGGPGKFKQSFGPECVSIATHWERTPSRLMSALKDRYEQYLRKRQRLSEREVEDHRVAKPVASPV